MSVLCWLLTPVLCAPFQEVYRFRVEVPAVYVDVFVTRDGKYVTGLTVENFEVFDSGVLQEIRLVDLDTVPLATMMVLDSSGSVYGEKLRNLRAGSHAFIGRVRDVDEVGLLAFSQGSRLLRSPTRESAALHKVVDQLTPGGATGLYDALYAGLRLVEGKAGRPLLVVFTDGKDNSSWLSPTEVLEAFQSSEAIVHAIAVKSAAGSGTYGETTNRPEDFLDSLGKATGGKLWYAESSAGLEDIYLRILQEMGSRYLLSYQPRGAPREGWHPLEVKVKGETVDELRARAGYMVAPRPD